MNQTTTTTTNDFHSEEARKVRHCGREAASFLLQHPDGKTLTDAQIAGITGCSEAFVSGLRILTTYGAKPAPAPEPARTDPTPDAGATEPDEPAVETPMLDALSESNRLGDSPMGALIRCMRVMAGDDPGDVLDACMEFARNLGRVCPRGNLKAFAGGYDCGWNAARAKAKDAPAGSSPAEQLEPEFTGDLGEVLHVPEGDSALVLKLQHADDKGYLLHVFRTSNRAEVYRAALRSAATVDPDISKWTFTVHSFYPLHSMPGSGTPTAPSGDPLHTTQMNGQCTHPPTSKAS